MSICKSVSRRLDDPFCKPQDTEIPVLSDSNNMSLIESCQLFGTDFLPLQNRFIYDNDRISAVGHDGSNIHNEDKEDENISDDDADMPYLPSMDELMNCKLNSPYF